MDRRRSAAHRSSRILSESVLLQLDRPPGLVRIEAGHLARQGSGVDPQIFSVKDTLVVDDEGFDSGYAILRGPRYQGEPANHLAIDEVIERTPGGRRSLRFQHAEVVPVKRLGLDGAGCRRERFTDQVEVQRSV